MNGFVVPAFAARYAGSPPGELPGVAPLLRLCFETNQVLAAAGVIALSAAVVLWSAALVGSGRGGAGIAVLGFIAGALPAIGLLTGHLRLHLHGMAAVIVVQAVWSIAVGVRLVLGAPTPGPARG